MLYSGSNNGTKTKVSNDCSKTDALSKSNYHQLFIDQSKFSARISCRNIDFDMTPKDKVKFVVTTDVHENTSSIKLEIQGMDEFDFHINAGDNTYHSSLSNFNDSFFFWHQKPFLQVLGNHDADVHYKEDDQVDVREPIFYQNINGIHFFYTFVFNA